jgi:hypothetical protein
VSLLAPGEEKTSKREGSSESGVPLDDPVVSSDAYAPSDSTASSDSTALSDAAAKPGARPTAGAYKAGRRLVPGYWLPFGIGDGVGFGVGLSTSGGDILRRHVYGVGALYDLTGESLRFRFSYLYNASPHLAPFLSAAVSERPPFQKFSPSFASYQGIQAIVRGSFAEGRSELGAIVEAPYGGPNLLLEYNSLKTALRMMGPERGVRLRQEAFLNLKGDDFLVLTETASAYAALGGISVLSAHVKLRGGMGERRDPVTSGSSGAYEFVPLDGILTPGYASPVRGEVVLNAQVNLGFPLFVLERGVNTFPLFFEGLACGFLINGGVVFSGEGGPHASRPEDEFCVAPSLVALLQDPSRYIRSSVGVELKAGFLLGYEFPLDAAIGYTFALSEGGMSGFYGLLGFDFRL